MGRAYLAHVQAIFQAHDLYKFVSDVLITRYFIGQDWLQVSPDWRRSGRLCPCPWHSGSAWTSSGAAWPWRWSRPTCWCRRACSGCWGARSPGAGDPPSAPGASRHTVMGQQRIKSLLEEKHSDLTTISKSSCKFLQLLEKVSDVAYSKYHSLFFIRLLNFWGFFSLSAWNLLQIAASWKQSRVEN